MDKYQAMAYVLLMATEWLEKIPEDASGDMLIEDVLGGESDGLNGMDKALEALRLYTILLVEGMEKNG
jgi:hypothetical protein